MNSTFLDLPSDVRLEIYRHSIMDSRQPSDLQVYANAQPIWRDNPSPFLGVNKQIRTEVQYLLKKSPFTMRVTGAGKKFDGLALSAFIAQQRQGLEGIPHLVVEVWPPGRPSDIHSIWKHLQQLRNDMRDIPRISRFDLVFLDSEWGSWTNSVAGLGFWLTMIRQLGQPRALPNIDIYDIMRLFTRLTNVTEAHVSLPDSLASLKEYKVLESNTEAITEIIMGDASVKSEAFIHELDEEEVFCDQSLPTLELLTATNVQKTLDEITEWGMDKLTEAEWDAITSPWPSFERLGHNYRGKSHFVKSSASNEQPSESFYDLLLCYKRDFETEISADKLP